jgi:hypothetical protein
LEKFNGEWRTASGESIEKDEFLQYTAKYWYKHLEDVQPSSGLTERMSTFLKSPNFQTLLQLQHLYVDGQFSVFTVAGQPESAKFLKRAFPDWFVKRIAQVPNLHFSEGYRLFLHEWSHFLKCGCCENPSCTRSRYAGEIDRCLFGALGDENFMSGMRSRYLSFKFSTNDRDGIQSTRQCYEGYSACGKVVYLVQFA